MLGKKGLIYFLFFILVLPLYAQNFYLNDAILTSIKHIANKEGVKEVIFNREIAFYPLDSELYNANSPFFKQISFKTEKELLEEISDKFGHFYAIKGEINLCHEKTKKYSIKIHPANNINDYINKINSQTCVDETLLKFEKTKILTIELCQPIEIGKHKYFLVFTVKPAYKYFQQKHFVGINIFDKNYDSFLYVFITNFNGKKTEISFARKLKDFFYFYGGE